ncbi:unnamed protein product [Paramecium sonneborni]|uniref:Defective in cullin neddylation protein n=1 Tax=Paramecium sonneborni TaxID=65129 RepID=A0A8S1PK89_9CILI|nr:unnamed protein product [Paramecium sonneborni]
MRKLSYLPYKYFLILLKFNNKNIQISIMKQEDQDEISVSQSLGISRRFAKYLLKQVAHYDRVRKAKEEYQKLTKRIQSLTVAFSDYEIDGLIQYKDKDNDSYTRFMRDAGLESHQVLQLYITYKFGAQKGAMFTLQEFILGMIRLRCNSVKDLKKLTPELLQKIKKENKYKKLYKYYFGVISLGKNVIRFTEAITLWESLLKDQFKEITDFIQFCQAKPQEFQTITKVSFDLWCQVWKFFETIGNDYQKFDENDAWPLLIFEYVEFKKK